MTAATYSRKLVAEWSDRMAVGIWDNTYWSVRLYADRAIARLPYVKWINNSGSLEYRTERLTGKALDTLLAIAEQQVADDADYTERVKRIVWDM